MEAVTTTDDEPYDLPTHPPSFQGHGRFTLVNDYRSHLRRFPLRFKDLYLDPFGIYPSEVLLGKQIVSTLNGFFVTCAPTLEHLTLYGRPLSSLSTIRNYRTNLGPKIASVTDSSQIVDLSSCKRLRTFRVGIRELFPCPPYVTQALSSLEYCPRTDTIALDFTLPGVFLVVLRSGKFGRGCHTIDAQLCRLAELRDGGLRVSFEFNELYNEQGIPMLDDFDSFMTKFRSSPHAFTILWDSHVVTRRGAELQ